MDNITKYKTCVEYYIYHVQFFVHNTIYDLYRGKYYMWMDEEEINNRIDEIVNIEIERLSEYEKKQLFGR